MELSFSPEEQRFRAEVRAWIADAVPEDLATVARGSGRFSHAQVMQWHKILHTKGWAAPHWPKQFGGPGFSPAERFIFQEEVELSGMPHLSPFGLVMVGPLIQRFGSDAQRERYLPKILAGEEIWCQGYSEPNAGSDLASLRCSAEDKGDHFLVNGQKTWTTYAQYADWIFCLVRTSSEGKKQAGISFLLIDMKSEGLEAKPMLTLGHSPAFCDTYFTNVKVPKENLLGPLDGGWTLAKALLGHERNLVGSPGIVERWLRLAKDIAQAQDRGDGTSVYDDPHWRQRFVDIELRLRGLKMANYRALAEVQKGRHPGAESSILKIVGTELIQTAGELCMEVMGHDSLAWHPEPGIVPDNESGVGPTFCYDRAATIYAGSNEIQRNIIAKHILQLPS
ncbi:acyl-CoA dehydrogenase family protein [Pseudenhygromyxa sp. WMMC2535]|uniref:acyl-CoA dehydrogenase family protein n=1 Tax=Pseudenhygromyxa sp. WMMC2535 TaxID=2712867 RepID=UPI00155245AF|nr:acyl-CoA dehydrogenase family protein [Pseudenhygromyxa sp. WMMC2535]NVB39657.1 acyl-CoA dehydrogenase family protein [Pseudenhygromyxa sp. WMMC2535]